MRSEMYFAKVLKGFRKFMEPEYTRSTLFRECNFVMFEAEPKNVLL